MTKRLISFLLTLVLLVVIPVSARWRYNPYTNKLDYYESGADIDFGDLADVTLTGAANGNILYYNGAAWVNLATGANGRVLTLAGGIPSWAAPGAPAAHAASHEVGGADLVDHDQLTNYLAAQHLTLPNTIVAVLTDHNAAAHVALGFLALPSTIAAVLTDHNKAAHDALLIDADTVDGEHAAAIVTNARVKAHFPDTIANVLSDHNLLAHTALGLFDQSSDVDHDATTNYLAAQHLNLPSTIAAVLTDHNLAAHTALGIPNPANVFYVSATGGDYTTIQAALNAENAGGETFLVGPGTYVDTISFTANNQVVKALGNIPNVIVTQADANIVDGGAWSECMVQGIAIRLTAPTTAINAIQVGTGTLVMFECRVYLATAIALVQADQPSLAGFTGAGTIRIGRGNYQYYHTGNTGAGGIKAAFRANVNLAELHLHKIDVITITNSGTAAATTMYVTTGTAVTEMHNVIDAVITDPNATLVVGLGYVGGAGSHNVQDNHVDVVATNNTSYGLYHNGTGTIRSAFNALHASDVAGASYAFYVGASATLISHFDDLRSDDGNNVAGTLTFVNSPADGDLAISDELDVTGISEFSGDTYQYEDVFISWADSADHMRIVQGNAVGIEAQALIYVQDDRTGATANEADEASLHITNESGNEWAFFADIGKVEWGGNVLWNWASDVDNAQITQAAVAGVEDVPLIKIDDDRTGVTAEEEGEATIVIDAEGIYAMYVADGWVKFQQQFYTHGANYFYGMTYMKADNIGFAIGSGTEYNVFWDSNAAEDELLTTFIYTAATISAALWWSDSTVLPNGMTDHNDYLTPTFILANAEGADANDYAGVVIGERGQTPVTAAHYFDFYAMTGAVDGAVDPSNAEVAAIFRIGASGTAVPDNATTPGDVLFEGAIEINGSAYLDGGQLKFPGAQSASADVNTQDDYEEGTFTPAITFGGAAVDVTYNAAQTSGSYTKIGNRVFFNLRIVLTNKGSSNGDVQITGLPFTVAANPESVATMALQMENVSFADTPMTWLNESVAVIDLQELSAAGAMTTLTDANFANDSRVHISGHYKAIN